jgi:chitinase
MQKVRLIFIIPLLICSAAAFAQQSCYNIVGYYPSWVNNGPYYINAPSKVDYSKFTHICYAFAIPGTDGNIGSVDNGAVLQDLVTRAHAKNVKVLLSIGGWLTSSPGNTPFEAISTNTASINRLADACARLVTQYNLDGIDLDWEYPTTKARWNALAPVVANRIHGMGKLFTAAVAESAYYGDNYDNVAIVDLLNIMCYGPYSMASNAMTYWTNRGVPQSKRMLGVPFYSADNTTAQHVQKSNLTKTTGAGIMIWDIASEYGDINAIYNTLGNVCGATPVPNNLALGKPVTVSSSEDAAKYPASAAVDNSYGTRWSSTFTDPQWIYVDLGARYNINRVKLTWEAAYATAYRIEVSNTAAENDWTVVKSVTNSTLTNDHTGLTATGRYVRIYGTARATTYGYSLYALEVYGTPETPAGTNLALNKTVTASSIETDQFIAANAVDGSQTTRWSSLYTDPQWIYVDLGAIYNINRIKTTWETAYATAYKIEVSNTAAANDWQAVYSTATNTGGLNDVTVSGTGRYVRIYGTARSTVYGYSLWELEVYGTPAATGTNLALNKSGTASSLEDATLPASLAFDGNATTRWASTEGVDPQWIAVDLGASYSINRIKLLWETAYGKSYTIAVSTNNADWNDVYNTTTGDGGTDDVTITAATGRYVRITGTARGTTYGYSLYEFEVYGTATTLAATEARVEFYPNPAKESLTIGVKNATGQSKVSIVSTATGAPVYTTTVQTGETLNVNTSTWPKGIYIINLETGNEKKQERIVIEK